MIYKLVFLGPPGSGKGTQAKKLAERLNIPHVALGDILREAIRLETEIGKLAKTYVEAGNLVPDEVTIGITKERLVKDDCKNGFILDGFPRSLKQAEALDEILKGSSFKVLYFTVSLDSVIDRNSGRLSCAKCGAVFHTKYNPSKNGEFCDKCGQKLYQRKDDSENVIRNRFDVYEEATKPLIEFYNKKGNLINIDASSLIEDVFLKVGKVLGL